MRKIHFPFLFIMIVFILSISLTGCKLQKSSDIDKIIISKEKTMMDEWSKGHTLAYAANCGEGITYFDPSIGKRLDGMDDFSKLLKSAENKFTIDRYEMLNPSVQINGKMAVLSYNLVTHSKTTDGREQESRWNSTEVYEKTGNEWKIIHAHWSFTQPQLKP